MLIIGFGSLRFVPFRFIHVRCAPPTLPPPTLKKDPKSAAISTRFRTPDNARAQSS